MKGFSLFLTSLALKPTNLSQERRSSWHSSDLKLAQCGRNWCKTKDSQNQLHPTLSKLSWWDFSKQTEKNADFIVGFTAEVLYL